MQHILTILLSCFTGWVTIWITLRMLFHPRKPVGIGGLKLQGFIPANQQAIAQQLGKVAGRELLSFSALKEKVTDPAAFNKLRPEIESQIDHFLREKLKDTFPMLSMFIGDKTINQLKAAFLAELEGLFPVLMKSYMDKLEQDIDIEKLVTGKIAGFSLAKAEEIMNKTAKKLFLKLQVMGATIGLVAGFLQVLINIQVHS